MGLIILGSFLVGCGDDDADVAAQDDQSMTSEETTSSSTTASTEPPKTTDASGAQQCEAENLTGTVINVTNRLSSGNGSATILIAAHSGEPCTLSGTPRATFLSSDRNPLMEVEPGSFEPTPIPAESAPVELMPTDDTTTEGPGRAVLYPNWRSAEQTSCDAPEAPETIQLHVGNGVVEFSAAPLHGPEPPDSGSNIAACDGEVRVRPFAPSRERPAG